MKVTNSTVTNNTALVGGGLQNEGATSFIVRNSIVAGNTTTYTAENFDQYTDIYAFKFGGSSFTSEGFNLIGISDGSSGFTNGTNNDKVGSTANPINPLLGSLADNGGPTPTHKPLPGSPAIDKGNSFGLLTDQRGFDRPLDFPLPNAPGGDGSDIGAFEAGKEECKNGGWRILGNGTFRNQGQCVSFVNTGR